MTSASLAESYGCHPSFVPCYWFLSVDLTFLYHWQPLPAVLDSSHPDLISFFLDYLHCSYLSLRLPAPFRCTDTFSLRLIDTSTQVSSFEVIIPPNLSSQIHQLDQITTSDAIRISCCFVPLCTLGNIQHLLIVISHSLQLLRLLVKTPLQRWPYVYHRNTLWLLTLVR